MITHIQRKHTTFTYRAFSTLLAFTFIFSSIIPPQRAQAQTIVNLPPVGTMLPLSPAYTPAMIKGINIDPQNPLQMDFIIDSGDTHLEGVEFELEATKLIKYFLASLTLKEEEMWVNLSPYEKNRIIPEHFSQTEMGRDLLVQDYLLKQLTASLIYPEDELGKKFWDRVYTKAQEQFGTTEIPMNTFNKVWIVPESANVFEHEKGAFVVDSHLKVMLEEDYLALESNVNSTKHGLGNTDKEDLKIISGVSSEIIREILIPEIEHEVNNGKTFANLRQIFNSMILATWYKQNLKESLLSQVYVNQNKIKGVELDDTSVNQQIYDQYVEAFKKGVYNYIKEDIDPATNEIIPRKYFSGGFSSSPLPQVVKDGTMELSVSSPVGLKDLGEVKKGSVFTVDLRPEGIGASELLAATSSPIEDSGRAEEEPRIVRIQTKEGGEVSILMKHSHLHPEDHREFEYRANNRKLTLDYIEKILKRYSEDGTIEGNREDLQLYRNFIRSAQEKQIVFALEGTSSEVQPENQTLVENYAFLAIELRRIGVVDKETIDEVYLLVQGMAAFLIASGEIGQDDVRFLPLENAEVKAQGNIYLEQLFEVEKKFSKRVAELNYSDKRLGLLEFLILTYSQIYNDEEQRQQIYDVVIGSTEDEELTEILKERMELFYQVLGRDIKRRNYYMAHTALKSLSSNQEMIISVGQRHAEGMVDLLSNYSVSEIEQLIKEDWQANDQTDSFPGLDPNASSPIKNQEPQFRTAEDLWSRTYTDQIGRVSSIGERAPFSNPSPGYVRYADNAMIAQISGMLNNIGLSALLRKSLAFTRMQFDYSSKSSHLGYLVKGMLARAEEPKKNHLRMEILIPDFRREQVGNIISSFVIGDIVDPKRMLEKARTIPALKQMYENRMQGQHRQAFEELIERYPFQEMDLNEKILSKTMQAGILHEIGLAIWTAMDAKADFKDKQAKKLMEDWNDFHARWDSPSLYLPDKGPIYFKNFLKQILNPEDWFYTNIFADKFAMYVDQHSIYYSLDETLDEEEKRIFREIVDLLRSEGESAFEFPAASSPVGMSRRKFLELGLAAGIACIGAGCGSGGLSPDAQQPQPEQPQLQPEENPIDALIADLMTKSFQEALNSAEHQELIERLTMETINFIVFERMLVNHQTAIIRLSAIVALGEIGDKSILTQLEEQRDFDTNETVRSAANDAIRRIHQRSLAEALGDLNDQMTTGLINRQNSKGIFVNTNNDGDNGFVYNGAITAQNLMYEDWMLEAERYLDFLLDQFKAAGDQFNGFADNYIPETGEINKINGFGRTAGPNAYVLLAIAHYTALTKNELFLPIAFGIVDWFENKLIDPDFNVLHFGTEGYDFDAVISPIVSTEQNLSARGALDALVDVLNQAGNYYPEEVTQTTRLAQRIHDGLAQNLWKNNQYIVGGSITEQGFTADTRLASDVFALAAIQSTRRPLPEGYDVDEFLNDAHNLFNVDLDIQGYSAYTTTGVPHLEWTSWMSMAYYTLDQFKEWEFYLKEVSTQAIDDGEGGVLLPQATRDHYDIFGNLWNGPPLGALAPTVIFQLARKGIPIFQPLQKNSASSPVGNKEVAGKNDFPNNMLSFSTDEADFLLHLGMRKKRTKISEQIVRTVDSAVIETGFHPYEERDLDSMLINEQTGDLIKQLIKFHIPIFYTDLPASKWAAKQVILHYLLEGSSIAIPSWPFLISPSLLTAPLLLPLLVVVLSSIRHKSWHNILNPITAFTNFYTPAVLRSAITAKKIIEEVVPEAKKLKGSKPTILIDFDAGHSDIKFFLRNKWARDFVVKLHSSMNYPLNDSAYADKIGEIRLDKGSTDLVVRTIREKGGSAQFSKVSADEAPKGKEGPASSPVDRKRQKKIHPQKTKKMVKTAGVEVEELRAWLDKKLKEISDYNTKLPTHERIRDWVIRLQDEFIGHQAAFLNSKTMKSFYKKFISKIGDHDISTLDQAYDVLIKIDESLTELAVILSNLDREFDFQSPHRASSPAKHLETQEQFSQRLTQILSRKEKQVSTKGRAVSFEDLYHRARRTIDEILIIFALVEPRDPITEPDLWEIVYQALDVSMDGWYDYALSHRDNTAFRKLVIDPGTIQLGRMWNRMTKRIVSEAAAKQAGLQHLSALERVINDKLRKLDKYPSLTSAKVFEMSTDERDQLRENLIPYIEIVNQNIWDQTLNESDAVSLREKIRDSIFTIGDIAITANINYKALRSFISQTSNIRYSTQTAVEKAIRTLQGKPYEDERIDEMRQHELREWLADINNIALKEDRSKQTHLLANYILQYPDQIYFVLEILKWKPQLLLIRALLVSKFSIIITAANLLASKDWGILVALYGLEGQEPMTMEELGIKKLNGVTRERVRQKEGEAIRNLIANLTAHLASSPISDEQKRIRPRSGVGSSPVQSNQPGGIDMNPNNLDLQTQGRGMKLDIPIDLHELQNIRIDGFTPVIINVTPLTNLPLLLGLVDDEEPEDTENVRDTPGRDPMDHKMERYEETAAL